MPTTSGVNLQRDCGAGQKIRVQYVSVLRVSVMIPWPAERDRGMCSHSVGSVGLSARRCNTSNAINRAGEMAEDPQTQPTLLTWSYDCSLQQPWPEQRCHGRQPLQQVCDSSFAIPNSWAKTWIRDKSLAAITCWLACRGIQT